LLPRECKTANCFAVLEATHNRSAPVRRPLEDEHRMYLEKAMFCSRAPTRLRTRCHRACKKRKPAHSKATSVKMESPHSDQFLRRPRHSQPDTTKSPVSKPPTMRSLQKSSVVSRCREIQLRLRNLQPNVFDPTLYLFILSPDGISACGIKGASSSI
jgi:hypothetical protein